MPTTHTRRCRPVGPAGTPLFDLGFERAQLRLVIGLGDRFLCFFLEIGGDRNGSRRRGRRRRSGRRRGSSSGRRRDRRRRGGSRFGGLFLVTGRKTKERRRTQDEDRPIHLTPPFSSLPLSSLPSTFVVNLSCRAFSLSISLVTRSITAVSLASTASALMRSRRARRRACRVSS